MQDAIEILTRIITHGCIHGDSQLEHFQPSSFHMQIHELPHAKKGYPFFDYVVGLEAPVLVEADSPFEPGESGKLGVCADIAFWLSTPA